ncbi:MAG: hypothetical protein J6V41_04205 [Kiritimatiellae bacterium]|nr:hypothetical protein [Kiritimatiellia bacterium]
MKNAYLKLFRLPNLPTAPGDALAGAAFVLCFALNTGVVKFADVNGLWLGIPIIASAFAALFLYMYGLADNDIVGVNEDIANNSPRPIVLGEITLNQAKIARAICLVIACVIGFVANLSLEWCFGAIGIVACVWFYNRFKNKCKLIGLLAMGLCRSMSLLAGALAVYGAMLGTGYEFSFPLEILYLMLGWTGYIAAVTYLAYDEHNAKAGLGFHYYLLGLVSLIPILGVLKFHPTFRLLPIIVCAFMFVRWILVLAPLKNEHTPADRRKAVGQTISALIYLQLGFALMPQLPIFYVPMLICFAIAYLIKASKARVISGS